MSNHGTPVYITSICCFRIWHYNDLKNHQDSFGRIGDRRMSYGSPRGYMRNTGVNVGRCWNGNLLIYSSPGHWFLNPTPHENKPYRLWNDRRLTPFQRVSRSVMLTVTKPNLWHFVQLFNKCLFNDIFRSTLLKKACCDLGSRLYLKR